MEASPLAAADKLVPGKPALLATVVVWNHVGEGQ